MPRLSRHAVLLALQAWLFLCGCWLSSSVQATPGPEPQPDWVLIPDERRATVWQVFNDGKVTRLDFSRLPMSPWPGSTPNLALYPSPQQDQVIYGFNNDLWLLTVATNQHRRLTRVGLPYSAQYASVNAQFMAWAQDGRQVLYQVMGGETESQGDGPHWTVKPRKADYGVKRLTLATGASNALPLKMTAWNWHSPTWTTDSNMFVTVSGPTRKPPDEELHAYSLKSHTSSRLVEERAWWGIPKLSRDGLWLTVQAGKRGEADTGAHRPPEMRSKIVKIHLPTRESVDMTPLGRWAEFNAEALSPQGRSLAYFRRNLKTPGDPSGSLVANERVLLESSGRVEPYWINETRLAFVQARETNEGGPRIGVIDISSGKLIANFDLPAAR